MANVSFYLAADMTVGSAPALEVIERTPSRLVLSDGYYTETYMGTFTYDQGGGVAGVLSTVRVDLDGTLGVEITDIGRDASQAVGFRQDGQIDAFYQYLFSGADRVQGSQWGDTLVGFGALDVLRGFGGDDVLYGRFGNDRLFGGKGMDSLSGEAGADVLDGGWGGDRLLGGTGNDTLAGGAGRDQLVGGVGKDLLRGGADADVFVFRSPAEAGRGEWSDTIADFARAEGDKLSLRAIDADLTAGGDQAFAFIGVRGFSGEAGELRQRGGSLLGDLDGDGVADFRIEVAAAGGLAASDILL